MNTTYEDVFFYLHNVPFSVLIDGEYYPSFFALWDGDEYFQRHLANKWELDRLAAESFDRFFARMDEMTRRQVLDYIHIHRRG